MKIVKRSVFVILLVILINLSSGSNASKLALCANNRQLTNINKLLSEGKESVRIVCFGDSITGKYYHTGGRRAYSDLLASALKKIYPNSKMEIFNAGVSGDITSGGLTRLEKDVLSHNPHLVIIMFGMNDIVGDSEQMYVANMKKIVAGCRNKGAEVVICTQNSIYPTDPQRTVEKLAHITTTQRELAAMLRSPLADCYAAFEEIRVRDATEWSVLMSDAIHPNLNGHKLIAQVITSTITGHTVEFSIEPSYPPLFHTFTKLNNGEPIRILSHSSFDYVLAETLRKINSRSDSTIDFMPWSTSGFLSQVQEWSWTIRDIEPSPDLVLVSIPFDNTVVDDEYYIRVGFNLLNGCSGAGKANIPPWDCVVVLPGVLRVPQTVIDIRRDKLARDIAQGHDLYYIERETGNKASVEEILTIWLRQQSIRRSVAIN